MIDRDWGIASLVVAQFGDGKGIFVEVVHLCDVFVVIVIAGVVDRNDGKILVARNATLARQFGDGCLGDRAVGIATAESRRQEADGADGAKANRASADDFLLRNIARTDIGCEPLGTLCRLFEGVFDRIDDEVESTAWRASKCARTGGHGPRCGCFGFVGDEKAIAQIGICRRRRIHVDFERRKLVFDIGEHIFGIEVIFGRI